MSGTEGVGFTQMKNFCWMEQADYCDKYHESNVSARYKCDRNHTYEGINFKDSLFDNYSVQSPLRNAFDRCGDSPGLGFVSGLGRWTFSFVELGVGGLGLIVGLVHALVKLFFLIEGDNDYMNDFGNLYERGALDFWNGLKESFSFGFYRPIQEKLDESAMFNAMKEKVYSRVPE